MDYSEACPEGRIQVNLHHSTSLDLTGPRNLKLIGVKRCESSLVQTNPRAHFRHYKNALYRSFPSACFLKFYLNAARTIESTLPIINFHQFWPRKMLIAFTSPKMALNIMAQKTTFYSILLNTSQQH